MKSYLYMVTVMVSALVTVINGAELQKSGQVDAEQKAVPTFRFLMGKNDQYCLMPWRDQIWIVAHSKCEHDYIYDRKTGEFIRTIDDGHNKRKLTAGIHPDVTVSDDYFRKVVHVPQRGDVIIAQADDPYLFVYENKKNGVFRGQFSKVHDFTTTQEYPLVFCQENFLDDPQVDKSVLYLCKKKHGAYIVVKHLKIESLKNIRQNSLSAFCMHEKEFLCFTGSCSKRYIYDLEGKEVWIDNIQNKVDDLWQTPGKAGIYRRVNHTSYFYDGSSAKAVEMPIAGGLKGTLKTLEFYENPELQSDVVETITIQISSKNS
jgi:hypothetical protein